jgi:hypothetical protein
VLNDRGEPVAVGRQFDHVGTRAAERIVAPGPFLGGRCREALLDLRGHPHLAHRARRRVDDVDHADRRHVVLAWVAHGDRQQVVTQAQPCQRLLPRLAGEVADHGDEPATVRDRPDAVDRPGQVGGAEALGVGRRGERRQHGAHLVRAGSWRDHVDRRPGHEHGTEPVLVAGGQEADAGGRRRRGLGLVVGDGPEPHRRRRVDHQPGGEVAVGDLLAYMRLAGSRRHVPVDTAHVVTGLV